MGMPLFSLFRVHYLDYSIPQIFAQAKREGFFIGLHNTANALFS